LDRNRFLASKHLHVYTFNSYVFLELVLRKCDFLDSAQLLTQNILKVGYVDPRLK
jgi:hypothetical protein